MSFKSGMGLFSLMGMIAFLASPIALAGLSSGKKSAKTTIISATGTAVRDNGKRQALGAGLQLEYKLAKMRDPHISSDGLLAGGVKYVNTNTEANNSLATQSKNTVGMHLKAEGEMALSTSLEQRACGGYWSPATLNLVAEVADIFKISAPNDRLELRLGTSAGLVCTIGSRERILFVGPIVQTVEGASSYGRSEAANAGLRFKVRDKRTSIDLAAVTTIAGKEDSGKKHQVSVSGTGQWLGQVQLGVEVNVAAITDRQTELNETSDSAYGKDINVIDAKVTAGLAW